MFTVNIHCYLFRPKVILYIVWCFANHNGIGCEFNLLSHPLLCSSILFTVFLIESWTPNQHSLDTEEINTCKDTIKSQPGSGVFLAADFTSTEQFINISVVLGYPILKFKYLFAYLLAFWLFDPLLLIYFCQYTVLTLCICLSASGVWWPQPQLFLMDTSL